MPAALLILPIAAVALWFRRPMVSFVAIVASLAIFTGNYSGSVEEIVSRDGAIPRSIIPNREIIRAAPRFIVIGPNPAIATWYSGREVINLRDADPVETFSAMEPGEVLLGSSTAKKPIDLHKIDAAPISDEVQNDKHLLLFVKRAAR
jgi:hypothetical protein